MIKSPKILLALAIVIVIIISNTTTLLADLNMPTPELPFNRIMLEYVDNTLS